MVDIPKTQQAAVRIGSGATATCPVVTVPVETPAPHQILIKINWTGVCASDKSLIHDDWAAFGTSMQPGSKGIVGHEGAGVVVAVGEQAKDLWKIGDRAGVKWVAATCGHCYFCTNGQDELHCLKQLNSGFTVPGSFQEYCLSDARYASHIPEGVTDEEAGPIMCGGVTAYVGMKRSAVKPGQWVVVSGAGGGLGHLAVQYAKAMGMRVIAIDGGEEKEKLCKSLGAEAFIDFKTCPNIVAEVTRLTTYGAHGVVVTAATKGGYENACMMLRPGGTLVAIGLPSDPTVVAGAPPIVVAMRKLNIVGSITGTLNDVQECLDFTARGLVHPILVKGTLADVDKYVEQIVKGTLTGRAVLKVSA